MSLLPVAEVAQSSLTLGDGTRLDADVWRPAAPGRYPVLLMRQPYGRRIASTVVYAHPAAYAARGYIVVIQDVRGTGSSTGRFQLFADEADDGAASARWARDLPGSSGKLGMYGFSYQGNTQLLALSAGAPVDALAPAMVGWQLRDDWAYSGSRADGGVIHLAATVGWSIQMAAIAARHRDERAMFERLVAAAGALPLAEPDPLRPEILGEAGYICHHHAWLDDDPAYWQTIAPAAKLPTPVTVPMLHIGGWQDQMLMGTLGCWQAQSLSPAEQPLLIGPWAHLPWGQRVGALDLGPEASSPVDRDQIAFFDRHLKGEGDARPQVRLFDIGSKRWQVMEHWPDAPHVRFGLASTGLAAATTTDGRLDPDGGGAEDVLVHDPWRPVPSHPPLSDRAAIDDRADVLVYTSAALTGTIVGAPDLTVEIAADQPSFDLSATLSVVEPSGRVIALTHGYRRAASGRVHLALRPTCYTLQPGQRLRLSLAAAAFPAFPVNAGAGGSRTVHHQVIVLRVAHAGSHVSIPLLP